MSFFIWYNAEISNSKFVEGLLSHGGDDRTSENTRRELQYRVRESRSMSKFVGGVFGPNGPVTSTLHCPMGFRDGFLTSPPYSRVGRIYSEDITDADVLYFCQLSALKDEDSETPGQSIYMGFNFDLIATTNKGQINILDPMLNEAALYRILSDGATGFDLVLTGELQKYGKLKSILPWRGIKLEISASSAAGWYPDWARSRDYWNDSRSWDPDPAYHKLIQTRRIDSAEDEGIILRNSEGLKQNAEAIRANWPVWESAYASIGVKADALVNSLQFKSFPQYLKY